jgi:mono/diheme cytochrome c family protein
MAETRIESRVNILLIVALLSTLGLLLTAGYKGWREEHGWHAGHTGKGSAIIADVTVNLGGTPKQEHCLTCHPEGRPAAAGAHSTPSRNHPDIAPHSMYDLGCTACHLGEGMAADTKISHGRMGNEARKVLAGEDLQASCYQCHELKPLKGAERAWRGSRLFSETACDTCHTTGGRKGASYGPDLSDAGSFLGLKEIRTAIENPKADLVNSIMPKFPLSPDEIKAISYFLKSRVKESYYETPMTRMAKQREQERLEEQGPAKRVLSGQDLLKEKKCLACHRFGESDGQIGPDLSYMAFMRQNEYIKNFLRRPGSEIPGAIMPRVRMSADEGEEIIRLLQQKQDVHLHGGNTAKNVYMMLCQRCHAAQGDGFGIIQANLANFPRPFRKNADFFKSIPDKRIVESIEKGIPGTSMPPYGELFGQDTTNSVVDLLFRVFIRTERADKKAIAPPARPAVLASPETSKATFERECSRCHGVEGNGKGPEYLKHLPRPRDLTNRPYFNSLTDERIVMAISYGVPGTGMHPFADKIPSASIWGLVNTIREFSKERGTDDDGR